jgi:hypothetical protein
MQSFTIDGIIVMPPLIADYKLDPTIVTNKEGLAFEQGYNFEYHNFLFNTRDVTINKFSSFTLTDTTNVIDYFDIKDIPFEYPINFTTYLAFNTIETDPFSGLSAVTATCLTSVSSTSALSALSANNNLDATYLTITDSITLETDNSSTRALSAQKFISRRTKPSLPQEYYFNVMLIDAVNCYIYHLDGEDRWYLSHKENEGETLKFIKVDHIQGFEDLLDQIEEDGGDKIKFQYNMVTPTNIRVYKQLNGKTQVLKMLTPEEREIQPNSVPVRLEETLSPDLDSDTTTNEPNISELTEYTTMRLRPRLNRRTYRKLIPTINNYSTSISNNDIKISNRSVNHRTNMLVHTEYYYLTGESIPINFFSLKNDQTPYGITNSNAIDPRNQHNYMNRVYNKIDTGSNQLEGAENITLEYSTGTHTYTFNPGMNYFNTPQDLEPYNKININDTTLIESGSTPGGTPAQADKIFKSRKANDLYSETTRWGKSREEQLGTWLCTWLSGGDDPRQKPVWVDRYYNPSRSGYVDALIEITDFVHNKYSTDSLDLFESNDGQVIDIPSKLTLEPGMKYAYHRIGSKDIENNLSILDPYHVQKGLTDYKTISNKPGSVIDDTYIFDGKYTGEIPNGKNLGDVEQLSLSFDIDLTNYKNTKNHQIIGNYTSQGMGLFQSNDTSPFMFLLGSDGQPVNNQSQNSSIRIYNNEFQLYNYITNDSFLKAGQKPGLYLSVVVRELPENIFAITTVGDILEITHDGIVLSNFTQWRDNFSTNYELKTGFTPEVKSICYDDRYIYILSHTGTGRTDYKIHAFDMVSKQLQESDDMCKTFIIDIPKELTRESTIKNRGRYLSPNQPPNHINISDGTGDYGLVRTLYLSTGDISKNTKKYIWTLVKGGLDPISKQQVNHDLIYCFSKETLQLLAGFITDNNLADSSNPLSIIDFATDSDEKIWVTHSENLLTIYNGSRDIVKTVELPDQQAVSLVVTRDFDKTVPGKITDKVVILGNTAGTEVLTFQIGPVNHPTNDPSSADWRKASPWLFGGNRFDRTRFSDSTSVIYDDLTGFDDTTQVLYPFTDGTLRFGEQQLEIYDIPSSDPAGRVLDGDYEMITEGFDFFVNEDVNILKGNIFDAKTCKLDSVIEITDLVIDDLANLPQLINHYEYSVLNFERYSVNNLNWKINLEPLFKKQSPDRINLKLNLEHINEHPYTGYTNMVLNINNTTGRVEWWINGQLHPDHVYTFDKQKYRFPELLTKKIMVGATPFLNDTLLYSKLNTTAKYIVSDIKIRDINMYNKCLSFHEITNIMRKRESVTEMRWEITSKKKSYIDTIERMFNHSIPPRKSNMFDIVIRNSSIRSLQLQSYIAGKVKQNLIKLTPAGTSVNNITWSNELLDFTDQPEDGIDYNPIADEIIVDPSGITLPAYLPYILQ